MHWTLYPRNLQFFFGAPQLRTWHRKVECDTWRLKLDTWNLKESIHWKYVRTLWFWFLIKTDDTAYPALSWDVAKESVHWKKVYTVHTADTVNNLQLCLLNQFLYRPTKKCRSPMPDPEASPRIGGLLIAFGKLCWITNDRPELTLVPSFVINCQNPTHP